MVVLVLVLVIVGSFSAAVFLLVQGMSWGMIALGYVAGGWAGMILGLLLIVLMQGLGRWRRPGMAFSLHKRQSQLCQVLDEGGPGFHPKRQTSDPSASLSARNR